MPDILVPITGGTFPANPGDNTTPTVIGGKRGDGALTVIDANGENSAAARTRSFATTTTHDISWKTCCGEYLRDCLGLPHRIFPAIGVR